LEINNAASHPTGQHERSISDDLIDSLEYRPLRSAAEADAACAMSTRGPTIHRQCRKIYD